MGKRTPCARRALGSASVSGVVTVVFALQTGVSCASTEDNLADLSLEELSNIEITSVSKHPERLLDAAASIFVITNDDIRRSGATTLPEALRLAPNLEVARTSASSYAISARGFNNAIGNKLLVLIDGRTVYTPLYSGVDWAAQNVMLDDVDRIEVISGPGATLWGANAVNGVINIITRSAGDTQGGLLDVGDGSRGSDAALRYGGALGNDGHYRVYGMGLREANTSLANGTSAKDAWGTTQGGFRSDWGSAANGLTLQGDAYSSRSDFMTNGSPTWSGDNLLARWNRQLDGGGGFQVQAYYDHVKSDAPVALRYTVDTYDIEAQQELAPIGEHRIQWGGGYRYAKDSTETHYNAYNPLPIIFIPTAQNLHWANLFVQDEVSLTPALKVTAGLKGETNIYTGTEYLPDLRLAWKPADDALLWGALSRAVREPARLDRDFYLYLQLPHLPLIPVIKGGPDFQSEVADVAQIGYRGELSSRASYSVTLFRSFYDKLRSGQPAPAFIQNLMYGTSTGIEAWGTYQAAPAWRISGGFSILNESLALRPESTDPTGPSAQGNDPANWWMLRSSYNLSSQWDFDATLHHVGALPNPAVSQYTSVDTRLAWRPWHNLELSLTLQNLFEPRHVEFGALASASEIDRGAWLRAKWGL